MSPAMIWKRFIEVFPGMKNQVEKFYGHGDNSIKLFLKTKKTLIFTVTGPDTWELTKG